MLGFPFSLIIRGNGLLIINPIACLDGDEHFVGLAGDIGGHIPEIDRRRLLGLRSLSLLMLGSFLGCNHRFLTEELLAQGLVGAELLRQLLVPHHFHDAGQSLAVAGDEIAGEGQLTVTVEVDQFEGQRGAATATALQSDSAVLLVILGGFQTIFPEVLDLVVTSVVFEHFNTLSVHDAQSKCL